MSVRSSWCNTHRGPTEQAIAVAVIEANSGPGGTVWSCAECVERYGIVPLDEQSPGHPAFRIQYRDRPPARGRDGGTGPAVGVTGVSGVTGAAGAVTVGRSLGAVGPTGAGAGADGPDTEPRGEGPTPRCVRC
ncbi:hypothetical protein ACMA1D_18465 [Streptomyces sp. 796.1]|uniref:hypothetical protein n=1 Tax=Streptomyces sp. 796.1 TaxID=3163029 RepID=UPI0039C8E476